MKEKHYDSLLKFLLTYGAGTNNIKLFNTWSEDVNDTLDAEEVVLAIRMISMFKKSKTDHRTMQRAFKEGFLCQREKV